MVVGITRWDGSDGRRPDPGSDRLNWRPSGSGPCGVHEGGQGFVGPPIGEPLEDVKRLPGPAREIGLRAQDEPGVAVVRDWPEDGSRAWQAAGRSRRARRRSPECRVRWSARRHRSATVTASRRWSAAAE